MRDGRSKYKRGGRETWRREGDRRGRKRRR